jgi:hypothetical protein
VTRTVSISSYHARSFPASRFNLFFRVSTVDKCFVESTRSHLPSAVRPQSTEAVASASIPTASDLTIASAAPLLPILLSFLELTELPHYEGSAGGMEVITKIPPSDLSSPQHSFVRSLVRLSCSALLLFGFLDSCRSFLTFAPSSICFGVRRPPSQGHCRPTATCANCTDSEQDIRIIPSQPSSLVRTDLSLVL